MQNWNKCGVEVMNWSRGFGNWSCMIPYQVGKFKKQGVRGVLTAVYPRKIIARFEGLKLKFGKDSGEKFYIQLQ
jgi:hypothetical protein